MFRLMGEGELKGLGFGEGTCQIGYSSIFGDGNRRCRVALAGGKLLAACCFMGCAHLGCHAGRLRASFGDFVNSILGNVAGRFYGVRFRDSSGWRGRLEEVDITVITRSRHAVLAAWETGHGLGHGIQKPADAHGTRGSIGMWQRQLDARRKTVFLPCIDVEKVHGVLFFGAFVDKAFTVQW